MKFFIDTANLAQIREANEFGILDGVTTNPSLMITMITDNWVIGVCKIKIERMIKTIERVKSDLYLKKRLFLHNGRLLLALIIGCMQRLAASPDLHILRDYSNL